jgi:hypothetical protein
MAGAAPTDVIVGMSTSEMEQFANSCDLEISAPTLFMH